MSSSSARGARPTKPGTNGAKTCAARPSIVCSGFGRGVDPRRRRPGVVFRMQMMRALCPTTAATIDAVADAMPLSRQRKLRAVRSAVRMARAAHCGIIGNQALAVEVIQAVVHEDHSFFTRCLERGFHLVKLAVADQIPDRVVGDEEFIGEHAACPVGGRQQIL